MSTTGITTYYHKRDGQLSLSCLERLDGLYYLNGDRYIIDETTKSYTRLAPHERDDTTQRIILIALSCLTGIGLIVYAIVLIRRCYCHYQLRSLQESVNTPEQISLVPQPQQEVVQTTEKLRNDKVEQTPLKQEPLQPTAEKEEPQENQEKESVPSYRSGHAQQYADNQEFMTTDLAFYEKMAAKGPAEKSMALLDRNFWSDCSDARKSVINASKSKDPERIQLAVTAFVDTMRTYSQKYTDVCEKYESLLNIARGKALFQSVYNQILQTMREIQWEFISIEQPQRQTLKMWWNLIIECSAFLPKAIAPLDAFSTALCESHSGEPKYIAWSGGYRALQNYYQQMRDCYSVIHTNASEQEIHSYAKGQLARFLARVNEERIKDYNDYKNKDIIIQHLAKCSDPNDPIRQTVRIGEYLPHFSNPQAAEIETFLQEVLA